MAETPNVGLYVTDDETTNTLEWVRQMASASSTSNMMLLDALIYALQSGKANKIVESENEPEGLIEGDEWDDVLGEGAILTEQDREEIAALASTPDQYVLIDSITTAEEVNEIRRTVEPDGTPYSFKRIMANIYCPAGAVAASMYVFNGTGKTIGFVYNAVNTTERYSRVTIDVSRGYIEGLYTAAGGMNTLSNITAISASMFCELAAIDGLRFASIFPAGTKIDIYGVRINPSGSIDALADDIISKQEQYIGGDA